MLVNKNDYFDHSGIDLEIEFRGVATDNPTKYVEIFMKRTCEWMLEYIQHNFVNRVLDIENERFINTFKKAVCYQIDYIRMNGDLSIDLLNNTKVLAPNAMQVIKLNGFGNIQTQKCWWLLYGKRY